MSGPLEELRAASEAATAGEWDVADSHCHMEPGCRCMSCYGPSIGWWLNVSFDCDDTPHSEPGCEEPNLLSWADASFAVAAVNYVRALLAASSTGERPADDPETWTWVHPRSIQPHGPLPDMTRAYRQGGTGQIEAPCLTCAAQSVNCVVVAVGSSNHTPTPPDAGRGTPSDDGRAWADETLRLREALRTLALNVDGDSPAARFIASHLARPMPTAPTPAAPSGTTGATTGDES